MTGWLPSTPPPQLLKLLWLSHNLLSAHTGKISPPPWLHPRVAPPGSHTNLSSSHWAKPLTTTTLATSPCWYSALEFIKYPSEDGEWLISVPRWHLALAIGILALNSGGGVVHVWREHCQLYQPGSHQCALPGEWRGFLLTCHGICWPSPPLQACKKCMCKSRPFHPWTLSYRRAFWYILLFLSVTFWFWLPINVSTGKYNSSGWQSPEIKNQAPKY